MLAFGVFVYTACEMEEVGLRGKVMRLSEDGRQSGYRRTTCRVDTCIYAACVCVCVCICGQGALLSE